MDTSLSVSNNVGANTMSKNNPIMKRFFVPDAPASYLHGREGSVNQEAKAEVDMRQKRIDELILKQSTGRKEVEECDKRVKDFEALASAYMIAENTRNPTAEQNETINTLESSVSEIVLSGANAAGSAREQASFRIASKMTDLQEKADAARKQWNSICDELETERKNQNRAKDRSGLDFGPLQGGKMLYAPHRENRSMIKSSDDIIRDIWNIINGPSMLELSFNRIQHHLQNLRKSLRVETRTYAPGKQPK